MNIFRNITKNNSCVSLMGRWGMINDKGKYATKNIDWSNHDHCGGDLCNSSPMHIVPKNKINSIVVVKEKPNQLEPIKCNKNSNKQTVKVKEINQYNYTKYEMDYYLPYVL